jgi:hypothetical protein
MYLIFGNLLGRYADLGLKSSSSYCSFYHLSWTLLRSKICGGLINTPVHENRATPPFPV